MNLLFIRPSRLLIILLLSTMSAELVEGLQIPMKNSTAVINFFVLSKNVIYKTLTLLEDKDLLRLREVSSFGSLQYNFDALC